LAVVDGHQIAGGPGNPVVSTAPIEAFVWLGPISLTKDQIDVGAIHWAITPIPVQAWVPWNDGIHLRVQFGKAVAWTTDAVRVQWRIDHSDVAVWVWADAVQRHHPPAYWRGERQGGRSHEGPQPVPGSPPLRAGSRRSGAHRH
jgi:hypothetical protein